MPSGTSALKNMSGISSKFPVINLEDCLGCGNCYTSCPDTAVYSTVVHQKDLETAYKTANLNETQIAEVSKAFAKITESKGAKKYVAAAEKANLDPEQYFVTYLFDYNACKGCGECAEICNPKAISMTEKNANVKEYAELLMKVFRELPRINQAFTGNDVMLDSVNYTKTSGHGACMGCGEATAIRMFSTATYKEYGQFMIVASTGCSSVFSSAYPYNSFTVPWHTPLFENAPTTAMGVRAGLDSRGDADKKIWVTMGDGAAYDIGFQALSRLLSSGLNVNVLVLDTGAYSNTGGQTSTASFKGADAKMSAHGKKIHGKQEMRKNLINIVMEHPDTFAAQVSAGYKTHFIKAIQDANSFEGPSFVLAYTPCMPEHGIGDNQGFNRARAAVQSRAHPLVTYDPRKGNRAYERISLDGNPDVNEDWATVKGELFTFLEFAKKEGRFQKHFAGEQPTDTILASRDEVLRQWNNLQEKARIDLKK
ncbi:MAG: thiamine pyrophosphate-dependent enzyme [Candidatus Woesearchaeota archaeon]